MTLIYIGWEGRYEYLSTDDSILYESVKNSTDEKDIIIRKLLEDKSAQSRNAHCGSKY